MIGFVDFVTMKFARYFSHTIRVTDTEISLNHCHINSVPKKLLITKVEALSWCIALLSKLTHKHITDCLAEYLMHILDSKGVSIGSYKSYSEKKVNIVNAYIFDLVGKDAADKNVLVVLAKLLEGTSLFDGGDVMLIRHFSNKAVPGAFWSW